LLGNRVVALLRGQRRHTNADHQTEVALEHDDTPAEDRDQGDRMLLVTAGRWRC